MIYSIYKPVGWTSFDVVNKIRFITKEKKVGHGGTLDPFAEGVLIIGTGNDTKRLQNISNNTKSYEANLVLGAKTDTLDNEGKIIENKIIPDLEISKIVSVLRSFVGDYNHLPPMYSAKKVNGIRLYKLARKNKTIKRDPILSNISEMKLIEYTKNIITFSVTCSKGTYIRVLAKDIAKKLGTVGYLKSLVRTQVGGFSIDESQSIQLFESLWKSSTI